jgi:insertion element IS1 protein InsB
LALDRETRELKKRFHVGGKTREDARAFWKSFPPVYRQCEVVAGCCSTPSDKWEAYFEIIPGNLHRIVEKNKRETNHIERFNKTLKQKISRLGRKTLF